MLLFFSRLNCLPYSFYRFNWPLKQRDYLMSSWWNYPFPRQLFFFQWLAFVSRELWDYREFIAKVEKILHRSLTPSWFHVFTLPQYDVNIIPTWSNIARWSKVEVLCRSKSSSQELKSSTNQSFGGQCFGWLICSLSCLLYTSDAADE